MSEGKEKEKGSSSKKQHKSKTSTTSNVQEVKTFDKNSAEEKKKKNANHDEEKEYELLPGEHEAFKLYNSLSPQERRDVIRNSGAKDVEEFEAFLKKGAKEKEASDAIVEKERLINIKNVELKNKLYVKQKDLAQELEFAQRFLKLKHEQDTDKVVRHNPDHEKHGPLLHNVDKDLDFAMRFLKLKYDKDTYNTTRAYENEIGAYIALIRNPGPHISTKAKISVSGKRKRSESVELDNGDGGDGGDGSSSGKKKKKKHKKPSHSGSDGDSGEKGLGNEEKEWTCPEPCVIRVKGKSAFKNHIKKAKKCAHDKARRTEILQEFFPGVSTDGIISDVDD